MKELFLLLALTFNPNAQVWTLEAYKGLWSKADAAIAEGGPLYRIYRRLAKLAGLECPDKAPEIGVTRHRFPDGRLLRIFINYADHPVDGMPGNSVRREWS